MTPWNTTSSSNSKTDATNLTYTNDITQLQVRRQASLRTTESASNRSIFTQVSWITLSKTANTMQKVKLRQQQCTTPSGVGTRWREDIHYKSELNSGEWSASLPGHFTPTVSALRTYWYRWVGPQVGLNVMAKKKVADNFVAPAGSRTPCRPYSSLVTWLTEQVKDCAKPAVHIKENTAVTWLLASLTRTWCARTHVSLSQTRRNIPIPALS